MPTFYQFTESEEPLDEIIYKDTLGIEWQYNNTGRFWYNQYGIVPVDTLGRCVICTIVDAVLPEQMGLVPWTN